MSRNFKSVISLSTNNHQISQNLQYNKCRAFYEGVVYEIYAMRLTKSEEWKN